MNKVTIFTAVLLLQFVTRICYGQPLPCEKTMEESLKQTAEMLNKQETKDLWKREAPPEMENAMLILLCPPKEDLVNLMIGPEQSLILDEGKLEVG